jgi:hypothetical protein
MAMVDDLERQLWMVERMRGRPAPEPEQVLIATVG